MKTKDLISIQRRVLSAFPGFVTKGSLMLMPPAAPVLRAFDFDTSEWNTREFYVNSFFMPLYVPSDHIHFGFGRRVRREGWNADDQNLESSLINELQEDIPFFRSLESPTRVVDALRPYTKESNLNFHEAFVYALIRADRLAEVTNAIRTLLNIPAKQVWEHAIISRVESIKHKLSHHPDAARNQLAVWEDETVRSLGLEELRS